MFIENFEIIKESLKAGKLEDAITRLLYYVSNLDDGHSSEKIELDKELVLALNRKNTIEKDHSKGLISYEEKTTRINVINSQIFDLFKDVKSIVQANDRMGIDKKDLVGEKNVSLVEFLNEKFNRIKDNDHETVKDIGLNFINYLLRNINTSQNLSVKTPENAFLLESIFWDRVSTKQAKRLFSGELPIKLKIACHLRLDSNEDNYSAVSKELIKKVAKNQRNFSIYTGQIQYVIKINGDTIREIPEKILQLTEKQGIQLKILRIKNDVFRERDYILFGEEQLVLEWIPGYLNKPVDNMTLRTIYENDHLVDDWNIIYHLAEII